MDSKQQPTPRWAAAKMLNKALPALPQELVENILDYNYPRPSATMKYKAFPKRTTAERSPAYTPPVNGSCPFMDLPTELRRQIFAESLPSRDAWILPECEDKEDMVLEVRRRYSKYSPTCNLLVLNKTISSEVSEVVYEEREFVIHVHEGLKDGGIEFLHAGRQPLHYQDNTSDDRFWKFSDKQNDFGFRRLKKIRVQIFPSQEEISKHSVLNTYLMNLALVRLLDRSNGPKNRITSLTIEFMKTKKVSEPQGRAAIQRAEHYWWDPENNRPRESSIHGLPNIELVLRPFANLTGCHAVNIEMPSHIYEYARVAMFVQDLKASMRSLNGIGFADDDLEMKIESARWALEDYVTYTLHGKKHHKVDGLTAAEAMDLDSDSDDSGIDQAKKKKRRLSPASKALSPGSDSKKSRTEEKISEWQHLANSNNDNRDDESVGIYSLDDDEAFARALQESQHVDGRDEGDSFDEAELQEAIEASLADQDAGSMRTMKNRWDGQPQVQVGPLEEPGQLTGSRFWDDNNNPLAFVKKPSTVDTLRQMVGNRKSESSSVTTKNGSAFVGQGRTLGGTPAQEPLLNRWMSDGDNPWNPLPTSLLSFYRESTQIQSSNSATSNTTPALTSGSSSSSSPKSQSSFVSIDLNADHAPNTSFDSPPTKATSQLNISGSSTKDADYQDRAVWE